MHHFGSPNSGGIGFVCGGPRYQAESLTFGFGPTAAEIVPGRTEVILMWGLQSSASAPWSWGRTREAIRQGSKLIAIDPRPTPESRQADLWLQPRPGTDAALALGFIQVILTEQLWDREFVGRWTNGLKALRARAAEYPPERVEAISGVPADDIRRAARLYARASTAALTSGAPNGMGRNTLNYTRALCILIALTGNLDRPGGNRLLGRNPALGSKTSYEDYAALPPEQRRKRLGADRFKLHDAGYELLSAAARPVWHGIEQPYSVQFWATAHPPSVFRSILSGRPYQVRALLVQHNNILGCYSNSRVAYNALRSPALELSVVHEISMTPTAMLADYVLPAAGWIEKPFLWSSGRGNAVLSGQQIVAPRHERRSDYDLCRDLGRRLGQIWPDTVEAVWDEWLRGVGLSFRELAERDQPWLPPDGERDRHAALDPSDSRSPTASGRRPARSSWPRRSSSSSATTRCRGMTADSRRGSDRPTNTRSR